MSEAIQVYRLLEVRQLKEEIELLNWQIKTFDSIANISIEACESRDIAKRTLRRLESLLYDAKKGMNP